MKNFAPIEPIKFPNLKSLDLSNCDFIFKSCVNLTEIPELPTIKMSPEEFISAHERLKNRYRFLTKLVV